MLNHSLIILFTLLEAPFHPLPKQFWFLSKLLCIFSVTFFPCSLLCNHPFFLCTLYDISFSMFFAAVILVCIFFLMPRPLACHHSIKYPFSFFLLVSLKRKMSFIECHCVDYHRVSPAVCSDRKIWLFFVLHCNSCRAVGMLSRHGWWIELTEGAPHNMSPFSAVYSWVICSLGHNLSFKCNIPS